MLRRVECGVEVERLTSNFRQITTTRDMVSKRDMDISKILIL